MTQVQSAELPRLPWASPQEAFSDKNVALLVEKAMEHDIKGVHQLRSDGADVNSLGKLGVTPLLWSVLRKDNNSLKILLEIGADPALSANAPNGVSALPAPLWVVTAGGFPEMLRTMLEYRADPNFKYNGQPMLMTAAEFGKLDCGKILVEYGADIHYPGTNRGLSVFEHAVLFGNYEFALWIWKLGYTRDVSKIHKYLVEEQLAPHPGESAYKKELIRLMQERLASKPQ